mmetsp:Transcript_19666/g.43439  ORF Transcript_19666/g.43439 Transcript_19666/m.43439 type:complete len:575 (+) Transcript_19666:40-1764(+)
MAQVAMNRLNEMMTSDPEQGYGAGVIDAEVKYRGRGFGLKCEKFFALAFIVGFLVYVGSGVLIFTQTVVEFELQDDNGVEIPVPTFTDEFQKEIDECLSGSGGNIRRLQTEAFECDNVFCVFTKAPETLVIMCGATPILALLWLVAMYFVPRGIVWSSVAISVLIPIFLGVVFILDDAGDTNIAIVLFAYGGILALLAYWTRAKIERAARHLKTTILAIRENICLIPSVGILEVFLLGVFAMHFFFLVANGKVFEVVQFPGGCGITRPAYATNILKFQNFWLLWIVAYLNSAKLTATAMHMGGWYFGQQNRSALRSVKTSVTTSIPALSIGSLITAVVDKIVEVATQDFWWTNPGGCALRLLYACFQGCIMAMTRFAIITHAFTGGSFFSSGRDAYQVMKKNFVGGFVTNRVGRSVVANVSQLVALGIGLFCWHLIDKDNNFTTLKDFLSGKLFDSLLVTVLFIFGYMYLVLRPMFTILLIVLVGDLVGEAISSGGGGAAFAPMAGLFSSCVVYIIFSFLGDVVLDTLDTMFLAYAVKGPGSGAPQGMATAKVYHMLTDDVPERIETANAISYA